MQNVLILGGGASGLTAAVSAARAGARVTLLERGVRFVRINVPRRNQRALRLLQRAHFEWVRTDRLFLGVDL